MAVKLAEVYRGEMLDCIHLGSLAVSDSKGNILYALGDIDRVTYFRSSFKPLQGLVAMEKGVVEKFGLDLQEIALIVSSHSGESEHIRVLKSITEKAGLDEEALECGAHEPYSKEAARQLYSGGGAPTKLHCNCSGKHLGMMAAIKLMGLQIEGYSRLEHGIQNEIGHILRDFCNVDPATVKKGTDGCGIPVYAVPLRNMALGYANLCNQEFMEGKYKKSQNYIISAMTMYPEMVAGKGIFDTELMKSFGDRIISKSGAEGVYCGGLPGKGVGISIKIEDGNSRAIGPVVIELLYKMGVISEDELEKVKELHFPALTNNSGTKVGEIRPVLYF